VTSVGLLLHPSEGGGTLVRTGLVQGLARNSHGDESLLLSLCVSCGSLNHGHSVVLLPLGGGGSLLLLDREVGGDTHHCHGQEGVVVVGGGEP
jgi:hypothetical protein